MRIILLIMAFLSAGSWAAMTPAQALQLLRAVTDKAALVAADHRAVEEAYKVLADQISKCADEKKAKDDGSSK